MTAKNFVHRTTMGLAPALVGAAGYLVLTGYFAAAFFVMLGVVLCMETRVRMGYKLSRGALFLAHVAAGALLLFVLAGLAWFSVPPWAPTMAIFLLGAVALSGGVLLGRQYLSLG